MNIIFIGFKGSGKTSVGRLVAYNLNRNFVDTDSILESIYRKREGAALSCREIFKQKGREYFQALEIEALEEIKNMDEKVISLGGGTIQANKNIRKAVGDHITVFLYVEPEILYERIIKDGIPAFFEIDNPRKSFDVIYNQRVADFWKLSNINVDNSGKSVEETAAEVIVKLKEYYAG